MVFQACSYTFLKGAPIGLQLREHSHPPNPAHAETCASPREHRLYKWSFQASLLPSRNDTHVVPTAPVEGAPPLISKSDQVPRAHSGSTGAIGVSFLSWSFQARSYFSHKGAPLGLQLR